MKSGTWPLPLPCAGGGAASWRNPTCHLFRHVEEPFESSDAEMVRLVSLVVGQ